ncbi:MAG: carbamoyl phosphate synthase large subunit, partial [Gammaproteobacteria bacterium]|nr:carbamoyl phosphate synthase large subunit [Gammaproteobacteria bacterium]
GPEMKSTGEVMGIGETFAEAFIKSQLAAGVNLPKPHTEQCVFVTVNDKDKPEIVALCLDLVALGFSIVATAGTWKALQTAGIYAEKILKIGEGRPNIVDKIKSKKIGLIINTIEDHRDAVHDSKYLRTNALQAGIPIYTTLAGAKAVVHGLKYLDSLNFRSLQELHADL